MNIWRGLRRPTWAAAEEGLFFALYFLLVWLVVDPRLVHHALGVLVAYHPFSFHSGWPFLAEHLSRPGGALEYLVRFLTQFFSVGWFGALAFTALGWAGWRGADAVARLAGWSGAGLLRYLPPLALAVLVGRYSHPLSAGLSLCAGVGTFLLYVRWAPQRLPGRMAWIAVGCALLHWLAGAASLELAVLAALYELVIGHRPAVALAALGADAVARSLFGWMAGLTLQAAWGAVLPRDPGVLVLHVPLVVALFAFFPVVLAGVALGRARRVQRSDGAGASPGDLPASSGKAEGAGQAARAMKRAGRGKRRTVASETERAEGKAGAEVQPVVVRGWLLGVAAVVVAMGVAWLARDTAMWTVLAIDYHSQHERWDDALQAARYWPKGKYSVRCHRNVMLALYHTGRLGDEMFRYPMQSADDFEQSGADLYRTPTELRDMGEYFQESRLFLELGYVNQAEKCACEALETCGDLPAVLETLAIIQVVKDRPATARVFYNALARHPQHRQRARRQLAALAADPRLQADPRVARLRRNRMQRDTAGNGFRLGSLFQDLLEANPKNRMAFEFLMAFYLASGKADRVAAAVPHLKQFGFRTVPRYYQEAVAVAERKQGPGAAGGYRPDRQTLERLEQFDRLVRGRRSVMEAAQAAIDAGLGDSYFFYYAFGSSGI